MNKENTDEAADILNNPLLGYKNATQNLKWLLLCAEEWPCIFTGYKNVTRKEVGDVVKSKEGLWQVCRLLDMCSTFVGSYHI